MFPKSVCSLLFCKKKEKKEQRDPDFVNKEKNKGGLESH